MCSTLVSKPEPESGHNSAGANTVGADSASRPPPAAVRPLAVTAVPRPVFDGAPDPQTHPHSLSSALFDLAGV